MSLAGEAKTTGAGVSISIILVWGLPDSAGYNGWSGGLQGEYASGNAGATASLSVGQEYHGHTPITATLGYAAGAEVSAGSVAGYTWSANPILGFLWRFIKPVVQPDNCVSDCGREDCGHLAPALER